MTPGTNSSISPPSTVTEAVVRRVPHRLEQPFHDPRGTALGCPPTAARLRHVDKIDRATARSDPRDVRRDQGRPARAASLARGALFPARPADDLNASTGAGLCVPFAPFRKSMQDRERVSGGLGGEVVVARTSAFRVGPLLEQSGLDHPLQAVREDVVRRTQHILELIEAACAPQRFTQDQERPWVA